jgi:molecular chaperone DnaK (HSP70)
MADDDDRHDDDRKDDDDDDRKDDDDDRKDDDRPQSIEAAHERIGALERELSDVRKETIKRRDKIRSLEGELAREREQKMDESERAVEQARRETREQLESEHRADRVRSAVLLAAATKLRDPQDAVRYVDLEAIAEHDDGDVDKAAARAVDELLETKDYLAAGGDEPPSGARSPGPRGRQPAGTRQSGSDVNARIRKSLRR